MRHFASPTFQIGRIRNCLSVYLLNTMFHLNYLTEDTEIR